MKGILKEIEKAMKPILDDGWYGYIYMGNLLNINELNIQRIKKFIQGEQNK